MKHALVVSFVMMISGLASAGSTRPALSGYLEMASDESIVTERGFVPVAELREGDVISFREAERGGVEARVSHLTRGPVAPGNVPELVRAKSPADFGWAEDWLEYNGRVVLPTMAIAGVLFIGPLQLSAMGCTFALMNSTVVPALARAAVARARRKTFAVWVTDVKPRPVTSRINIIL